VSGEGALLEHLEHSECRCAFVNFLSKGKRGRLRPTHVVGLTFAASLARMSMLGVPPLGDTWHNGNSAGNKSMLTYRMGVGVPGHTGFTPAEECLSIPIKAGAMERAPLISRCAGQSMTEHPAEEKYSTHRTDFSLSPEEFAYATRPSGPWDLHAQRAIGDPPFVRRPEENRTER